MKQRGRRSSASLTVVAGTIDGRPKAPSTLDAAEVEVWDRIVASEPVDLCRTAAVQGLLADYCRHFIRADWVAKQIKSATSPHSEYTLEDVDRLMKMAERETRACVTIATKLRLTNQSRWQPVTAARAAQKVGSERKPWHSVG